MTSPDFICPAASRSFRRVENAEGLATSYYNLLIVDINIFSTYDVGWTLHRVPSVSQRGVQ